LLPALSVHPARSRPATAIEAKTALLGVALLATGSRLLDDTVETGRDLIQREQRVPDLRSFVRPPVVRYDHLEVLPCLRDVGQLRVPLHLYVDLAVGMENQPDEMLSSTLPRLLERVGEAVRVAMSDRYHWPRLLSGLMPVEPELLAIGAIANQAMPPGWDEQTLDEFGIGQGIDRVPLWLARRMQPPGRPQREPPPPSPGSAPAGAPETAPITQRSRQRQR
jgi:hypothetical protein